MAATFPSWLLAAADGDDASCTWCRRVLGDYFHGRRSDGRLAYSGARFETLGPGDPDRIELVDLVAVSMLGVDIPGHAALGLLEYRAEQVSAMLSEIPDVDLHEAEASLVDHASCAEELWKLISREHRVGPTKTSKLLARKRPRLLPVFDVVVGGALRLPHSDDHWLELRRLLLDHPAVVDLLGALRIQTGLPTRVSLLRTLDVLLWMSPPQRMPPPDPAEWSPKVRAAGP